MGAEIGDGGWTDAPPARGYEDTTMTTTTTTTSNLDRAPSATKLAARHVHTHLWSVLQRPAMGASLELPTFQGIHIPSGHNVHADLLKHDSIPSPGLQAKRQIQCECFARRRPVVPAMRGEGSIAFLRGRDRAARLCEGI